MIFRELSEKEMKILKVLCLHLSLSRLKLAQYLHEEGGLTDEALTHLEREGLITAKPGYMLFETIYCPTAKGITHARRAQRRTS